MIMDEALPSQGERGFVLSFSPQGFPLLLNLLESLLGEAFEVSALRCAKSMGLCYNMRGILFIK